MNCVIASGEQVIVRIDGNNAADDRDLTAVGNVDGPDITVAVTDNDVPRSGMNNFAEVQHNVAAERNCGAVTGRCAFCQDWRSCIDNTLIDYDLQILDSPRFIIATLPPGTAGEKLDRKR